jgi:hypothetical protein
VNDGNGGSDQLALNITVTDVTQLALQVSYPTPNANLGGGVELTSVTGFVEDLEDGEVLESDIDFISVNGQVASVELPTSQGVPVRFRAQVPVTTAPNQNTLNIALTDNSNNNQQSNQLLLNGVLFDSTLDALVVIDLATGERAIASR